MRLTTIVLTIVLSAFIITPMRKSISNKQVELAKRLLERSGFTVKRNAIYKLHTFEIEESVLKEFLTLSKQDDVRLKDCVTEALKYWTEIYKSKKD